MNTFCYKIHHLLSFKKSSSFFVLKKFDFKLWKQAKVSCKLSVIMNPKEKNLILKKCASTNELGILALANLNLREAKSYAGAMVDTKLYDTVPDQRYQVVIEFPCILLKLDFFTDKRQLL